MSYVEWIRSHFASLADGQQWELPRSGLRLERRGEELVVVSVLDAQQQVELADLRRYAGLAGIAVK